MLKIWNKNVLIKNKIIIKAWIFVVKTEHFSNWTYLMQYILNNIIIINGLIPYKYFTNITCAYKTFYFSFCFFDIFIFNLVIEIIVYFTLNN